MILAFGSKFQFARNKTGIRGFVCVSDRAVITILIIRMKVTYRLSSTSEPCPTPPSNPVRGIPRGAAGIQRLSRRWRRYAHRENENAVLSDHNRGRHLSGIL